MPKTKKDLPKGKVTKGDTSTKKPRKGKMTIMTQYRYYIRNLLRIIDPDLGISGEAMAVVNSFVNDIFERIVSQAAALAKRRSRKGRGTMTHGDIEGAVKLLLGEGSVLQHALAEGKKAIATLKANKSQ